MKNKFKVLVTRYFPGDAINYLKQVFDVDFCEQIQGMSRDELKMRIRDVDAVISAGDKIDREMIMQAEKLKVIADMWGGRGVDSEACTEKGIEIRQSGVSNVWISEAEAEHATLLMLAVARRLLELDVFVRSGNYENYEQANKLFLAQGLYGRKLGIVGGATRSGNEMVKRARAFNMDVRYWDLVTGSAMEALGAKYEDFNELIGTSDFIVIMSNGSKGYIFDKPQFDIMNHNAILVNVTSGKFINEAELVKALNDGRLAGAGLDKYENEPFPVKGLTDLKNAVLTPHSDGAMLDERNEIFRALINQCLVVLQKK